MKRFILIGMLLFAAIGAGYASVRWRVQQPAFPPHTIVYRLTTYDEAGKVFRVSTVLRTVTAAGTWKHTQINPDGPVLHLGGQLKPLTSTRAAEAGMPEHLNFKYVADKNDDSEMWLSPELQDVLMFADFRADGTPFTRLEAVEVTRP